ncbi:MAG TPA: PAS domain S-box protein, partial [Thermoanaerobaculia bacterium]
MVLALATLLRFALAPALHLAVPFILYYPAVVVCAWFGGLFPGVLSTALGGLIAWYVFIPPQYSFRVSDPSAPMQLGVFLVAGTLISLLAESLHRAKRDAENNALAMHDQRERLRITLASIGDAVIATDPEGRVTFMNPIAESLTGWRESEAAGMLLSEVFCIVNEKTRASVENPALRAIREGLISGLANHTILISSSGTEVPIEDSGAPIRDSDGNILGSILVFRDVSERRRSQQELLDSRDRLRMAMEAGRMGTWTRELDDSNRTRWSPEMEQIFGLAPGEFPETEEAFFAFVHRDDRASVSEAVVRAIHNREEYTVEFRYTRKGATAPRWMLGRGRAYYDAEGKPVRLAGFGWDITERKEIEEALRQQREWFRVTLDSIGDAVIATDTTGSITFLNPVAESLTGWTESEARGQPLDAVFRIMNEQTRARVENAAMRAVHEGAIVGLANHTVLIARD